jgi:hypothetical protein
MPFYARVNDAIGRANSALNQLYSYNNSAHPRSEPNNRIRNNARVTIDPAYYELQQGVREGRWEQRPAGQHPDGAAQHPRGHRPAPPRALVVRQHRTEVHEGRLPEPALVFFRRRVARRPPALQPRDSPARRTGEAGTGGP